MDVTSSRVPSSESPTLTISSSIMGTTDEIDSATGYPSLMAFLTNVNPLTFTVSIPIRELGYGCAGSRDIGRGLGLLRQSYCRACLRASGKGAAVQASMDLATGAERAAVRVSNELGASVRATAVRA